MSRSNGCLIVVLFDELRGANVIAVIDKVHAIQSHELC